MSKSLQESKSIGLVLSGGGVRGMAHIGLLKALEEHAISIAHIAGSSVGALVGALYAHGSSYEDMLGFFKDTPIFQYRFFAIGKPGLINTERYHPIFKGYFDEDDFSALKKPLHVVATDLMNGKEKVFNKGELVKPLLASAALTPFFSPVEMNGVLYGDGGIMNNFPKEYIEKQSDFVIGSNVSITEELQKKDLNNSLQLAGRITGLMIYASCREKIGECNIIVEPQELAQIGILDKKGIDKAFTIGYDAASFALDEILN